MCCGIIDGEHIVNEITLQLRKIADQRLINFFGIAELVPGFDFMKAQGGFESSEYPVAISIGIALNNDIVDQLPNRKTRSVCVDYRHHCYDIVNQRLDLTISEMTSFLQSHGFNVRPIPASKRTDDEKICGSFSHKLAANLSGLGWIGKSCLLVTPEVGPRVRFSTLLTNAPLEKTGTPMDNQCGGCLECVKICPVQAFTGQGFRPDQAREVRYDARKCDRYFREIKARNEWAFCGMCVYVCPFGKKSGIGVVNDHSGAWTGCNGSIC